MCNQYLYKIINLKVDFFPDCGLHVTYVFEAFHEYHENKNLECDTHTNWKKFVVDDDSNKILASFTG